MLRIVFAPLAAFLAATLLASCASPKPPVTAHIAEPVRAADPCAKYRDPTTFAGCHLFSSAGGWRFIPEAGRSADLDTQLRCAALRADANAYERCVSTPNSLAARAPAAPSGQCASGCRAEPRTAQSGAAGGVGLGPDQNGPT
jgi:hypothetical protein